MLRAILPTVLVALGLATIAAPARAQDLVAPDSGFRLSTPLDAPTLVLSVLALAFPPTPEDSIAWRSPDLRDRSAVNAFDRIATRRWSDGAAKASDALQWSCIAGVFGASALEALIHRHTPRKWVIQGVILAESVLVAAGLTQVAKYSVRRARPLFYNPAAPRGSRASVDANLSFWSGHTSMVAAALTSFAVVEWLDEPGSGPAWAGTIAAVLAIPTVAALRVAAGRHYPSDVLVGGAVGVAAGVAIPFLHRYRPGGETGTLRVDPLVLPGGSGAVATLSW